MSSSSYIEINNPKLDKNSQSERSHNDRIFIEGIENPEKYRLGTKKIQKDLKRRELKGKYPVISLMGIVTSLIFMTVAYSVYDGEHASGVVSFLGAIETNPAARSFFGLSLLAVGISVPYLCKFLNQLLGERQNFGLRMGKIASISAFGIAIFEMQEQSKLHQAFAYGGFFFIFCTMLFYSVKFWRQGKLTDNLILVFFIGSVLVPLLMIVEMIIYGAIFDNPVIIGSFEKASILSLFITILSSNIYLLVVFRRDLKFDNNLKDLIKIRNVSDMKKVVDITRDILFSREMEEHSRVIR